MGIRQATVVSNGLTVLKVSLLLVFGVVGVLTIQAWPAAPATLPPPGDFSDAMLLGIFAFTGFEAALVAAGETRNPRRDVPFAIAMSLLIVLILYAGVQIVCIATVPSLATSTAPFADAAVVLWGPVGEQVITLGAVVIMLGSLNSGFLATSRLPFAFAEQGDMPRRARARPREVQNAARRDSGKRRARLARDRRQLVSVGDHARDEHARGRVYRGMHRADRAAPACGRARRPDSSHRSVRQSLCSRASCPSRCLRTRRVARSCSS